jgi:hypothetical protein
LRLSPGRAAVRDDAHVPLDEFLPQYDANEIAAPPDAVIAAVRSLTPDEVPLVNVLMAVRSLPGRVLRRRRPPLRPHGGGPVLDRMLAGGFVLLAESPGEVVLGTVGRFWTLDGGIRRVTADEFAAFGDAGFAKAVMNFHVRAGGAGTRLTTETRILATDEAARRSFRRYWRIVMPGSALIRRAWLRAVRKRAENC